MMATTTKSKSTRKTTSRATTRKTAAKSATGSATGKPDAAKGADALLPDPVEGIVPTVVKVTEPTVAEPDLKKKDLINMVVERSGVKKKFAKPTIEAALAVIGEALASGRELNLPPMGKVRINRNEEKADGRVIVCRLRQPLARDAGPETGPETGASDADETDRKDPLAEPAE